MIRSSKFTAENNTAQLNHIQEKLENVDKSIYWQSSLVEIDGTANWV